MTDENILRASIRGKVVSWYPLDGNLNDVAGGNDLDIGLGVAGFAPGKQGQMLLKNSRAAGLLTNPFPLTTSNALSIGGWVYYDGTPSALNLFGISFDFSSKNTAFAMAITTGGDVHPGSYPNSDDEQYFVEAPALTVRQCPVTVRVTDSAGNKATSEQVLRIGGYAPTNGFYFVVARFIGETIDVFVDGLLAGTSTPPMPDPRTDLISYFQIGQQFGGVNTNCGLDELFFCQAPLTEEEILWLYNDGNGRSYVELGGS
ncbi:hypothetical protein ACQKIE_00170 [Luteibacter sp. NPDC031894]|uniref:hypothetical protein n=1 Tax=Luteibacter sp. NPDC031894 TaxID=3390572 RepID=UPI003D0312E3